MIPNKLSNSLLEFGVFISFLNFLNQFAPIRFFVFHENMVVKPVYKFCGGHISNFRCSLGLKFWKNNSGEEAGWGCFFGNESYSGFLKVRGLKYESKEWTVF